MKLRETLCTLAWHAFDDKPDILVQGLQMADIILTGKAATGPAFTRRYRDVVDLLTSNLAPTEFFLSDVKRSRLVFAIIEHDDRTHKCTFRVEISEFSSKEVQDLWAKYNQE